MYVFSTSQKHVSIQLVGKNKIQEKLNHFKELLGASVSYLGVSSAETSNEINAIVPSKFVALDIFVFHFFLRVAILEK